MKVVLTIAALMLLPISLWVGYQGHFGVMNWGMVATMTLFLIANLDRISEFKAGPGGIKAKTREIIAEAENTITELRLLAEKLGSLTLSLVKRAGRWGGYADDEEEAIKEDVLTVLRQVGVDESRFPDILEEWYRYTEFDYTQIIFNVTAISNDADPTLTSDWDELRSGGLAAFPTPQEIERVLDKHNVLTGVTKEWLLDYEHFKKHREHRRPEVWKNRK